MALLGYCLAVAVCRVPRYSQTNPKHKAICCMRRADKRMPMFRARWCLPMEQHASAQRVSPLPACVAVWSSLQCRALMQLAQSLEARFGYVTVYQAVQATSMDSPTYAV